MKFLNAKILLHVDVNILQTDLQTWYFTSESLEFICGSCQNDSKVHMQEKLLEFSKAVLWKSGKENCLLRYYKLL